MFWVLDRTGRFMWRPYYRAIEIDRLCERCVRVFLRARHGSVRYPLTTDDLTLLIEQEAEDLDLFADLSTRGPHGTEVEGVTTFVPGRRPRVQIARELSERPERQARLRTTLAHELGHVLLHPGVVERNAEIARHEEPPPLAVPPCTTETVRGARRVDWIEWQAGYASGALLMPRTAVGTIVRPILQRAVQGPRRGEGYTGRLIDALQGRFRALYLASHPAGAYGETVAQFRPRLKGLASLPPVQAVIGRRPALPPRRDRWGWSTSS